MTSCKLKLITILSMLLIKINSKDITFKILIENNKIKEDETDHSNFQTEIIKSFEVKINENQLPKENKENRINVKDIFDLIIKDENFKNVDISKKNILFKIHIGCYFIKDHISKKKLIDKGTANIYFRDKHNYHICCNRYNIKDEIEVTFGEITRKYNIDGIKFEFEDLNEDWFENAYCCFLTKREIQGVILKHSFLGNIAINMNKSNIFINDKDLFFKEEPINFIEIFQLNNLYKEFHYKNMTYYNIKTLFDFLQEILQHNINYKELYSIEYKEINSNERKTFIFDKNSWEESEEQNTYKKLKNIKVDKNGCFKIKRREDSKLYQYIKTSKKTKDLEKILAKLKTSEQILTELEKPKKKKKLNIGLCNSCKCCLSCL